jgi:acetylornithine deacetylase/succinyl-diaminopimelate desuccinylase-like protein
MASADTSDLDKYLEQNDQRIHDELFEFLRIPSVSARSEHNADTSKAAKWLKRTAEKAGMKAKLHKTSGHPIVVAEWRRARGAPTALIYGHYDVQPAEPL